MLLLRLLISKNFLNKLYNQIHFDIFLEICPVNNLYWLIYLQKWILFILLFFVCFSFLKEKNCNLGVSIKCLEATCKADSILLSTFRSLCINNSCCWNSCLYFQVHSCHSSSWPLKVEISSRVENKRYILGYYYLLLKW